MSNGIWYVKFGEWKLFEWYLIKGERADNLEMEKSESESFIWFPKLYNFRSNSYIYSCSFPASKNVKKKSENYEGKKRGFGLELSIEIII